MVRRNTPKAAKTDANPDTKETPSSTRTSRAKKASESEASASDITDTTDASAVNHDTKETDVDTGKSEDAVASKATPKKRRGSTKTTTGTDMETSTDVNVSMYKAGDGVDETVQVDKADGDGVSAIDMDVDVNADTNASISTDTVTETQAEVGANAEVDTTKKEGKTSRKGDKKNKKDNKVNKKQSGKRDKGGSQQVQDGKKGPPKDPLLGAGPKAPILANPVMPMNMPMNVPGGVPMRPPMQHMGMNTHTHPRAHMQPLPHTAHPHTRGPRPGAPQRGNGPKMGANGPKTGANGPKMGARKGPGAVVQPHLLTKKEPLTKKEVKDKTVDALAKMAQATWGDKSNVKFRAETVTKIYREHILGTQFSSHRLQVLEINQYLERYLWPNYKPDSKDKTHVLSLCVMINEKFRQGVPAWDAMIGVTSCDGEVDEAPAGDAKSDNQERFSAFMAEVRNLTVEASEDVSMAELARLVQLHVNLSKSLENSVVRQEVLPCVSLGVWTHVTDVRRQKELKQSSRIARQWKTLNKRTSQITALNETALYPSEQTLFDPNVVPDEYYSEGVLALPKLNLQFLTFHDYLLRNLNLFRLESTFEIREDIIDSVKRMPARLDGDNLVQFDGWSRMAMPTSDFSIIEVAKPELGHFRPRRVRADITIDLRLCRPAIAAEWEGLRRHDILFLCCVQVGVLCERA
ncbi:hypothetical protein SARC_10077 [Sphaeroforma arctica JP610]|uniref:Intron-binding protein aquarius N-terminal domain-containing protein n=1 Tax=Sphaeroforma arctica JP610 TaxID=667725 RepID=A0A0L0FLV2_9EUKA|nr:hypothetical protein SARC_10077 [Sphaeroforma arctica JP610]KNC77461.1 hypothetical protein SARC_10077 [Sphaeroforma arctica JP610]|eukprot:XP_014151363.1 hypothetical protein SARC_10077 [Sphaeroforma arctica JP610]